MSFLDDNTAYETWLRTQCDVDEPGLVRKHGKMDSDPFPFLRATFFRWARQAEKICPDLKGAPSVLSVGDTHLENFGTWRDAEGRWVWGFNDFDEAAVMPWAIVVYWLPTALPTTTTVLTANCSFSTSVTVSTLEPPTTCVTTTFDPLKASV